MICKERRRHRFKPNLREQLDGASLDKIYNKCFDCGFKRKPEDKGGKK